MAEIDKARSIGEQALQKILFNQDQERLNVWVAILNLENMYGTTETVEQTFNRASQNCDSLKVHFHMGEIYARSEKQTEAETIFIKMTKKFGRNPEVWIKYGIFHYKNSNCELARKLLLKSFNSLDKKDRKYLNNKFFLKALINKTFLFF
jgi:rRNA biogenesis protein RRP5